jgi:succinate dehydrogenase / fumarate reductase iron-sulfur subunit
MKVPLRVRRWKPVGPPGPQRFEVEVPETATVLDALEVAWARHDRSLMFRHACHHGSCGSCAMLVQGRERLPCVTAIADVWNGRDDLRVEPLRNLPLVADLVVDVSELLQQMAASGMSITRQAEPRIQWGGAIEELPEGIDRLVRFESCIECGICLSACPTMAADPRFLGPAGLAGAQRAREETAGAGEAEQLLRLVDGENGVWRCHGAWECTEACPQGVQPAERIMRLRRDLVARRLRALSRR